MLIALAALVFILILGFTYFSLAATTLAWVQQGAEWFSHISGIECDPVKVAFGAAALAVLIFIALLRLFWKQYTQEFSY